MDAEIAVLHPGLQVATTLEVSNRFGLSMCRAHVVLAALRRSGQLASAPTESSYGAMRRRDWLSP